MNKLYNTQNEIASNLRTFLENCVNNIRKTQLNIIPHIMFGMIQAESCSAPDIAKVLKEEFSQVQYNSIVKRINRFWKNDLFNPHDFYNDIIIHVLKAYKKKHADKRVHITFDHMFSHDNYTVFMITMKIGTQGIPLWLKCFKDSTNKEAFKFETLKEGIQEVSNLFKNTDFELIFLADRWFCSNDLLDFIDKLGHTYCVRIKGNISVYKDGIKTKAKKLKHRKHRTIVHENVLITDKRFKTNIVYSNSINTNTPWIIVTNKNSSKAIKDYGYRFGSIECLFKNQKSNGFNIEKISNATIDSFTTIYTLVCTCVLFLTIIGADYSKNSNCYKKNKIEAHKVYNICGTKTKKRIMSLFNTGLTLFKRAINSIIYIRIPFSFILYDI